jgi:tRNA-specific 2-thiouridylase
VAVRLDEPLRGVAPGQTVALYDPDPGGDIVLGSATIVGTGGS